MVYQAGAGKKAASSIPITGTTTRTTFKSSFIGNLPAEQCNTDRT